MAKKLFERIDKEKLEFVFKKSGLNKADFSVSLGHDKSFLTLYNNPNYDRMTKSDILLIQSLYGVDVTYVEPKFEEKKVEDATFDDVFFKKLQDTISYAVKRGVVRAYYEIVNSDEKANDKVKRMFGENTPNNTK